MSRQGQAALGGMAIVALSVMELAACPGSSRQLRWGPGWEAPTGRVQPAMALASCSTRTRVPTVRTIPP